MGSKRSLFQARAGLVERVCSGVAMRVAARELGVPLGTARKWWRRHAGGVEFRRGPAGGVVVSMPDSLVEQGRALSLADRVEIQASVRAGVSQRRIGQRLGRPQSTISRELARHRDAEGNYLALVAHARAAQQRRRPKVCKLAVNRRLAEQIAEAMDEGWSPKLISEMLAREHGNDQTWRVSHETIYRHLFVQGRGLLRQDLARQLSTGRVSRKPRGRVDGRGVSIYQDAFTIRERPAEVADRAVPGHWEGDLILGAPGQGAIGTLVERSTRFVILLHLPGRHTAAAVADAMIREMGRLPEHLRRSVTWDRGSEMADYARIQLELQAPVFFCDPRSPWQRGTNENTNRLLRHWFSKGSDLRVHEPDRLAEVAASLNARPRPTLDYQTPARMMQELLTTK
jgi:IS30 family transposase